MNTCITSIKLSLSTIFLVASPLAVADLSTSGSDQYNCPGDGKNNSTGELFKKNNSQCSEECKNLVFDCSTHSVTVNGQVKEVDGEKWLGCGQQTGTKTGNTPAKFTEPGCGGGQAGLLPANEPKILSEPLPCENCVIHRTKNGSETKGCIGLEAKLFDFVYKTCAGCTYTIIPLSGKGGGPSPAPGSGSGSQQTTGAGR